MSAKGFTMDRRGVKNIRRRRPVASRVPSRALMSARRGLFREPAGQISLNRQVRALIAAKKRDAADISRVSAPLTATTLSCLTSSTDFSTAASGTGILDADGDECMINNVRISGRLTNNAALDLDPLGNFDTIIRKIVVWFYKPLTVASAAGTLPPITEVLVSDTVSSLPVSDATNGGRFKILSDRKWNLGTNTYQAITAVGHAAVNGKTNQSFDYFVKVNKKVKYVSPAQSGTAAGGHYDSDVNAGRVSGGLLVLYTVYSKPNSADVDDSTITRLNYTG